MHEVIARTLYHLQVHLLFASLTGLAAWALTSIPRGSATTKYWIWVGTSLNFILPIGAGIDMVWATHLRATPIAAAGDVGNRLAQSTPALAVVGAVWLFGVAFMAARLALRLRADRRDARAASERSAHDPRPGFLAGGVPVRFGEGGISPAVSGVLRPHISLPRGIDRLLSEQELDAVLIHELTHARRRDNLIRLLHEVALCGLWFHPLVWLTGSRIALYRELSCDESVVRSARGGDLVSALAKLANPAEPFLLQASASSFLAHRLARLASAPPPRSYAAANALLAVLFLVVLLVGGYGTVTHTACCFVAHP